MYSPFHVEVFQVESANQQPSVETPLLDTDPGAMHADSHLEHVSYKPQTATSTPQEEEVQEAEEEQGDMPTFGEEDRCLSVFGELFGGLLSSVEVDFSDSPLGLTLGSVNRLLWPKTPETANILNKGVLLGRTGSDAAEDSLCVDLQQADIMTPAQVDTMPQNAETSLSDGYFPQVSTVTISATYHA